MRLTISDELMRLMHNWVLWRTGGSSCSVASPIYNGMPRGPRSEATWPILVVDAVKIDCVVQSLDNYSRRVVEVYWLLDLPVSEKIVECQCGVKTFYRWLDHAHAEISSLFWSGKKTCGKKTNNCYDPARMV